MVLISEVVGNPLNLLSPHPGQGPANHGPSWMLGSISDPRATCHLTTVNTDILFPNNPPSAEPSSRYDDRDERE